MKKVFLLSFLILLGTASFAAESAKDPRDRAEELVSAGNDALRDSNSTPSRVIDAALSYSEALKLFEKLGDTDRCCEMQANVFWCKKKMNYEDLMAFVAAKQGQQPQIKEAIAEVEKVATKEVPQSEAQAYFDRAQRFATEHPNDHLLVAIRWFEVAERFVGTPISIDAQKRCLEEQTKYAKPDNTVEAKRETLFSKPSEIPAVVQVALPDSSTLRAALTNLKNTYKADYAKTAPADKLKMVAKFIEAGQKTGDEPAVRHAMLSEAARIAVEIQQYQLLLQAVDSLAASFSGVDAKAEKKRFLVDNTNKAVAAEIAKLIDNPDDAHANLVAGSFFCFKGDRLDLGLPLWTRSGNAMLVKIANQELVTPGGALQQAELGDGWYDLAKKPETNERNACYERSRFWYTTAQPNLTGFTKDRVAGRLAEIDKIIPPALKDYAAVTQAQWRMLPGRTVAAPARTGPGVIGVNLKDGQRVRVVPHPTETWQFFIGAMEKNMTYKGITDPQGLTTRPGLFGAMTIYLEGTQFQPGDVITGPGRILIGGDMCGATDNNSCRPDGAIHVKIVPVEE